MWDVVLDSVGFGVTLSLVVLFVWVGRAEGLFRERGWGLVLAGACLVLLGFALDLSDNFPALSRFVVLGDTPTEAFLEKVVGRLIGLALVLAGFWHWLRGRTARLRGAEQMLAEARAELEVRVGERTEGLLDANRRLAEEIDERRQAEEALRASGRRLTVVLDATREGRWDWNVRTGAISYEGGWIRSLGYKATGALGVDFWKEALDPETMARAAEALQAHLEGRAAYLECECRLPTASGEWRWNLARGKVVEWDGDGRPVRMLGMVIDVDDRKKVEEARVALLEREREARAQAEAAQRRSSVLAEAYVALGSSLDYPTTLESLAQATVSALADWCVIDVLEGKGLRRVGAHRDPQKAHLVEELCRFHPRRDGGLSEWLATGRAYLGDGFSDELVAEVAPHPRFIEVMRILGSRSCMVVPLGSRGERFGALSLVASESGRRYAEDDLALAEEFARRASLAIDNARLYAEAQEASRLKDEFLATVSHELRTPLSAMLGWVQLLRRGRADAVKTARALEAIERNGRAQVQLVDDLVDVSRIMTGKLRLDLRPVDPAGPLEAALDSIRPAAEAKGVRVASLVDRSAGLVSGDPDRLQQIVWNLISNAVKFTPSGGSVTVRLERSDEHIRIVVRDTGEGIVADFLPFAFDRFRQADGTTTRRHGGVGLGLTIVRQLVELHGGTVAAESAGRGEGATLTVVLPRLMRSPVAANAGERMARHVPTLDGLRVLVVDDEPDTRCFLNEALVGRGAQVTTVSSVAEAMRAVEDWAPDVLVSDIAMPDEDGYALIRRVRALDRRLAGIPAVAVTALAREEDGRRALAAGYQRHLAKPFEMDELVTVIAHLTAAPSQPR